MMVLKLVHCVSRMQEKKSILSYRVLLTNFFFLNYRYHNFIADFTKKINLSFYLAGFEHHI